MMTDMFFILLNPNYILFKVYLLNPHHEHRTSDLCIDLFYP